MSKQPEAMRDADGRVMLCDVCGEPAADIAIDLRETEPGPDAYDAEGRAWFTAEADGEPHIRCLKHRKTPKTTYLDGRVKGGESY